MITTDTNGRKALQIFEQFIVDTTLPKHTGKKIEYSDTPQRGFVATNASSGLIYSVANSTVGGWPTNVVYTQPYTPSFSRKILGQINKIYCCITGKCKTVYVKVTSTPVQETFEAILGSGKKLEILVGRLEAHHAAIKEARAMGQIALADQLEAQTPAVEVEAILFAANHKEYITEDTLIDFVEKCEKGLRLDWIKNFTRLIPHDVRVKKLKMDSLNAFDNYAILHFDPNNKNSSLTKKEIEKKKDPILFGVIKGSRKLYHIHSWKDEFCDLTFNDLLDKYGKDALTLK